MNWRVPAAELLHPSTLVARSGTAPSKQHTRLDMRLVSERDAHEGYRDCHQQRVNPKTKDLA